MRPVVISHNLRNATAVGSQRSRTAVTSTLLKRRAEIVNSFALVGFLREPWPKTPRGTLSVAVPSLCGDNVASMAWGA